MTSLVRDALYHYPGMICAGVTSSITQTKRCVRSSVTYTRRRVWMRVTWTLGQTQTAIDGTRQILTGACRLAARPFLWPVSLGLDLSRRLILQVLVTVQEVLDSVQQDVDRLNGYLSQVSSDRYICRESPSGESSEPPSCKVPMSAAVNRNDRRQNAALRKVKETNKSLRYRVKVTEAKYEALRAEIGALRELYSDKMADLEGERDLVESDRRNVINVIQCAHALARDCHGDVQDLMEDLQDLAKSNLGYVDSSSKESLMMDFGIEESSLAEGGMSHWTSDRFPSNDTFEIGYFDEMESGIGSQVRLGSAFDVSDGNDAGFDNETTDLLED